MAALLLIVIGVVFYVMSHMTDDKMVAVVRFVAALAIGASGVLVYAVQLLQTVIA